MTTRTSLTLLLSAVACFAAVPVAQADATLLARSNYTETADGSLLLKTAPVRLSHEAAAVASDCISVTSGASLHQRDTAMLVNRCNYAVKLSYCIDAEDGGARRCEAIGRRGFESVQIAAGSRLALNHGAPVDAEINWVACKAGDSTYSTLINNGTRGECLVEQGPTTIATTGEPQPVVR